MLLLITSRRCRLTQSAGWTTNLSLMPSVCVYPRESKPSRALNPSLRDSIFGAEWPLMWGMRNRIAHGYMLVDAAIVRETMRHDVPDIVGRIRRELHKAADL